jgi:YidC/Oxa1 family membrane protein insertase
MRDLVIAAGPLDFLKPVGDAIGLLKIPFNFVLSHLYDVFNTIGPLRAVGAYGLAIIFLTIVIKLCLFPLYQKQLTMSRKTQEEQRRVAPELAALRKKHKGDPAKLNTEMMALYKEHGINPLGGLAGCLPTLAQLPILIGLYQSIYNFHSNVDPHFLWISNLTLPAHYTEPITWILPALAGATTFVQSKMMAPPPAAPGDDSQAAQMAQMTSTMSLIMPAVIIYFAFNPRIGQGLVLYWVISNLFSITQQYFVNGWGQLPILGNKPGPLAPAPAGSGNGRAREARGGADISANGSASGNGKVTPGKQPAGGRRRRR